MKKFTTFVKSVAKSTVVKALSMASIVLLSMASCGSNDDDPGQSSGTKYDVKTIESTYYVTDEDFKYFDFTITYTEVDGTVKTEKLAKSGSTTTATKNGVAYNVFKKNVTYTRVPLDNVKFGITIAKRTDVADQTKYNIDYFAEHGVGDQTVTKKQSAKDLPLADVSTKIEKWNGETIFTYNISSDYKFVEVNYLYNK